MSNKNSIFKKTLSLLMSLTFVFGIWIFAPSVEAAAPLQARVRIKYKNAFSASDGVNVIVYARGDYGKGERYTLYNENGLSSKPMDTIAGGSYTFECPVSSFPVACYVGAYKDSGFDHDIFMGYGMTDGQFTAILEVYINKAWHAVTEETSNNVHGHGIVEADTPEIPIDEIPVLRELAWLGASGQNEEAYNTAVQQVRPNITVNVTTTVNGTPEPVNDACVECWLGNQLLDTKMTVNGTVTFDITEFQRRISILCESNLSIRAYKIFGADNEYKLLSGLNDSYKVHYRPGLPVNINLSYAQFCPKLSVAFDNTNHNLAETKKIMDNFISDFYTLTNGMVQISITDYKEINNGGKALTDIEKPEKEGKALTKTGCEILIFDSIKTCNAISGGYKNNGTVCLGYTYQKTLHLNSAVICHEMLHFLFGARDEYTTGFQSINESNGKKGLESYNLDFNGDGDTTDKWNIYWAQEIPANANDISVFNNNTYINKFWVQIINTIHANSSSETTQEQDDSFLLNQDGSINGYIVGIPPKSSSLDLFGDNLVNIA